MSEYMPEDMSDRMPDRMPDWMPEDMPDHMPEDMPDRMPNRMSEDMSDRMPEDLPVRKCINVMVGITRSKVILNLTTSKTQQFCETSSTFELDNIKNKTILRDFLQKWKVECSADSLVPMRFAIFLVHLSKVLRLPRKIDAKSYEVLHLSRKIILANLQIWCSKMQPLSGNERPDLLTSLMNISFVLRLPRKMHLCRSSSKVPRLPSFLEMLQDLHVSLTFWQDRQSLAPATRNDIWASKSDANMWCFVHFDFEMCFAPQRRALFWHLNFQKWSDAGVFCTFWLLNVLRATTACTFSISQLPKVVRRWCVLYILTWKCASRHNGMHFFDISTSKSGPGLKCFVHFDLEMCFAPQRLLNCVSGVCSDLEIQQVVEQFSYMSKMYFLVFLYSWILFLIEAHVEGVKSTAQESKLNIVDRHELNWLRLRWFPWWNILSKKFFCLWNVISRHLQR